MEPVSFSVNKYHQCKIEIELLVIRVNDIGHRVRGELLLFKSSTCEAKLKTAL